MKKPVSLTASLAAFTSLTAAHEGLYHSYTGAAVFFLIAFLFLALLTYQSAGDTLFGHWALYTGLWVSFFVPVFYPHRVITGTGLAIAAAGSGMIALALLAWRGTRRNQN